MIGTGKTMDFLLKNTHEFTKFTIIVGLVVVVFGEGHERAEENEQHGECIDERAVVRELGRMALLLVSPQTARVHVERMIIERHGMKRRDVDEVEKRLEGRRRGELIVDQITAQLFEEVGDGDRREFRGAFRLRRAQWTIFGHDCHADAFTLGLAAGAAILSIGFRDVGQRHFARVLDLNV